MFYKSICGSQLFCKWETSKALKMHGVAHFYHLVNTPRYHIKHRQHEQRKC